MIISTYGPKDVIIIKSSHHDCASPSTWSSFPGTCLIAQGNLKVEFQHRAAGQEASNSKGHLVVKKDSDPKLDCFPELTFGVSNTVGFLNLPFKCYKF